MGLINTADVAKKYNVKVQTVAAWRKNGFPFLQYGKQTFLYDEDIVQAWLDSKKHGAYAKFKKSEEK